MHRMQHNVKGMNFPSATTITLLVLVSISSIACQEEGGGGGEEPVGGHDQPAPDSQSQPPSDNQKGSAGETDANGKKKGEEGYTQGFNQGVKPYSYGYNTGIKPYSYNFYQPYGGKPQVVEQGAGSDSDKKTGGAQPSPPPPMPAIEFPADFSAFGLSPADLAIPPPPAGQQGQVRGQQSAQPRQPIPINFGPAAAPPSQAQGPAAGQTPPPFNYAEYGIPMDIGSATGSAAGSPFGILGGGGGPPQPRPSQRIDGDDFNIFGAGGNNNGNNGLMIPVLEDGNQNQNNQQGLGIPLFGSSGSGAQNPGGNDFNFANNDLTNDFNVAASDFEPFNFQNFVPPEFSQTIGPTGVKDGVPTGSGAQKAALVAQQHQSVGLNNHSLRAKHPQPRPTMPQNPASNISNQKPSVQQRKQMYKASVTPAEAVVKRSTRSLNEQPHEKPLKDDPHSAWNILNMDPQYTNPNQGVYSYYPAYRMPS